VGAILRPCGRAAIQVRPCDARRLPGRPRGAEYESRLGGLPAQFDPSHDEIPKWAAYTREQCATMFLDAECKVVTDPYRDERLRCKEIAQGG